MAKPKKKVTSQERNEFIWGWIFIIPTMLGLIILNIIPIFQTIYKSFFKTGDFGRGNIFVGMEGAAQHAQICADGSSVFHHYLTGACGSAEQKNEGEERIPYNHVPAYGGGSGSSRYGMEMAVQLGFRAAQPCAGDKDQLDFQPGYSDLFHCGDRNLVHHRL